MRNEKKIIEVSTGDMIYRNLGSTGETVSIIGVGGNHIGPPVPEKESIKIIRSAIDAGVTFLDNSWDYHNGECEKRMGKALKDGYRQKVFLMTKIDGRTAKAASSQLDESLRRLKTDVIDLLQIHEVIRLEDPDRVFAQGGAIEALLKAKKAGKIRFVGFTGHKDPIVHLRMLDTARDHNFRFDTVQMPLNVMDLHFRSFERTIIPEAIVAGMGILGMKPMGSGLILESKTVSAAECLRYAMSLPVSTVITGIDSMDVLKQDLDAVRTFKPLSGDERHDLIVRTHDAGRQGRFEAFKTTNVFDATAQNPHWLEAPQ